MDDSKKPFRMTASGLSAQALPWNLELKFTDPVVGDGGKIEEVPEAILLIQWPLVKALHRVLGDVLEAYERVEGTVSVPRSFAERREPKVGEQPQ